MGIIQYFWLMIVSNTKPNYSYHFHKTFDGEKIISALPRLLLKFGVAQHYSSSVIQCNNKEDGLLCLKNELLAPTHKFNIHFKCCIQLYS